MPSPVSAASGLYWYLHIRYNTGLIGYTVVRQEDTMDNEIVFFAKNLKVCIIRR